MSKLKVETGENSVRIYTSSDKVETFSKGEISYQLSGNLLTFLKGSNYLKVTNPQVVTNVEINGVPLTEADAKSRLEVLFKLASSGGGVDAYTKAETYNRTEIETKIKEASHKTTYKKEKDQFPLSPEIDDYTIITSDGTETGEKSEVYKWDGFSWVLYSFSGNIDVELSRAYTPLQPQIYPALTQYKLSTPNRFIGLVKKGEDIVKITCQEVKKINKLQDNEDYIVETLQMYEVEENVIIDGNFKNEAGVTIATKYVESPESAKYIDVDVKNCNLTYLNLESQSTLGKVNIENIDFITTYANLGLCRVRDSFVVKNVTGLRYLHLHSYMQANDDKSKVLDITLDTLVTKIGQLYITRYWYDEESGEQINLPVNLNFKNVSFEEGFNLSNCALEDLTFINVDTTNIYTISINDCDITQEVVDKLMRNILDGGISSIEGRDNSLYFYNTTTPSQDIIDEFTLRGFLVHIE